MENIFISKDTMQRILSDVKEIMKNPLTEHGIYYKHDDDNLLLGYAMIVGPSETPYQYGYYFFKIAFSKNYPYSPPVVTFQKNPYNIRFHPNFYRTGKVCLSILNTWRGEQWTSCQTLSSILLTMCSVMNKNPLLNEPGITLSHRDNRPYNEIISYYNLNFSVLDMVELTNIENSFKVFENEMKSCFKKNNKFIEDILENMKNKYNDESDITRSTNVYSMNIKINLQQLINKYDLIKHKLLI
tara:strand:- start:2763 stop:3488 length:726 start_codon:yes stop_codon:yes gene_type:complete